jgi:hypothetical protein
MGNKLINNHQKLSRIIPRLTAGQKPADSSPGQALGLPWQVLVKVS